MEYISPPCTWIPTTRLPTGKEGNRINRTFLRRKARLACLGSQPCNPATHTPPSSPRLSCSSYVPNGPRFGFMEDRSGASKGSRMNEPGPRRGQQTKAATKAQQHQQGEQPQNPPPHPARRPAFPTFSCPTNFRNCSKFPMAPAATAPPASGATTAISRQPGKRREPLAVEAGLPVAVLQSAVR